MESKKSSTEETSTVYVLGEVKEKTERNFASLIFDVKNRDLKFSDCKLESFNVSHDMRSVICIGTVIISDADMRAINDVEKLLTHHNYLFCWSKDSFTPSINKRIQLWKPRQSN